MLCYYTAPLFHLKWKVSTRYLPTAINPGSIANKKDYAEVDQYVSTQYGWGGRRNKMLFNESTQMFKSFIYKRKLCKQAFITNVLYLFQLVATIHKGILVRVLIYDAFVHNLFSNWQFISIFKSLLKSCECVVRSEKLDASTCVVHARPHIICMT